VQDGNVPTPGRKRDYDEYRLLTGDDDDSQATEVSEQALELRMSAFEAMLGNVKAADWRQIGLISTDDNHTKEEEELGSGID
jgi:hypothetical protein